jgi:hypothetical protein
MHIHLHKIEVWVDRLIPYSLFALLLIIGIEFYYHETAEKYHTIIGIADSIIVATFIVDLIFKYKRVHNIPLFFRKYWLEIIAVMPIAFFIRAFEFAIPLQRIDVASDVAHGAIEAGAKWGILVREVEATGQASRYVLSARYLTLLARMPRLLQAIIFYERPTGNHHPHDKEFAAQKRPARL